MSELVVTLIRRSIFVYLRSKPHINEKIFFMNPESAQIALDKLVTILEDNNVQEINSSHILIMGREISEIIKVLQSLQEIMNDADDEHKYCCCNNEENLSDYEDIDERRLPQNYCDCEEDGEEEQESGEDGSASD